MNWRNNMIAAGLALAAGSASAIEVSAAWARPTAPGAQVGGGFLTLHGGATGDRLLSATSPAAATVELHTHVMDGGVARMRAVPVIEVAAGGKVELKPGGLHLMLIKLKAPLKAGEVVPVKLRFEKAGEIEARLTVSAQAPSGAAGHGEHHSH